MKGDLICYWCGRTVLIEEVFYRQDKKDEFKRLILCIPCYHKYNKS